MSDIQSLYLVFGGALQDLEACVFKDIGQIDLVGIFPDYAGAERAWRAKAQQTVDSAETRYFIVDLRTVITQGLRSDGAGSA